MSWTGASKVGEDDCADGQVTSYAEYDPSGKSPGDEDTVSVSYCGKSDEITVEIGVNMTAELTVAGPTGCPGDNDAPGLTVEITNGMNCEEEFKWTIVKIGGQANVVLSATTDTVTIPENSYWGISTFANVGANTEVGTKAVFELRVSVDGREVTDSQNRPTAEYLISCDCPMDPGPWQAMTESEAGPIEDNCDNQIHRTGTSDTTYVWYYNISTVIGVCIYPTAENLLLYRYTENGGRLHSTFHVTVNDVNNGGGEDCGKRWHFDWKWTEFNCIGEVQVGEECRETKNQTDPPPMGNEPADFKDPIGDPDADCDDGCPQS